jgi:hypothetical protein
LPPYRRNVRKKIHDRKIGQVAAKGDPRGCRGDLSGTAVSNLADASRGENDKAAGRISGHAERHLWLRTCALFDKPKSCKVVEGEVSEDGWCKAFALAD